jgi:hypothetical protein
MQSCDAISDDCGIAAIAYWWSMIPAFEAVKSISNAGLTFSSIAKAGSAQNRATPAVSSPGLS